MYELSDAFIILPGGFGTMDEFFEITTWGQLGLHSKPIGVLNLEGFYDPLINQAKNMIDQGFLKIDNLESIYIEKEFDILLNRCIHHTPVHKPKWITKEQT